MSTRTTIHAKHLLASIHALLVAIAVPLITTSYFSNNHAAIDIFKSDAQSNFQRYQTADAIGDSATARKSFKSYAIDRAFLEAADH
jgi:hypothetical protein